MEAPLKKRLIGAVVLAALALIFVPMLLKSPDVKSPDSADVPLTVPDEPDADGIKTVDIPLDGPVQIIDSADVPVTAADSKPANEPVSINPVEPTVALPDNSPGVAAGEFAVVISAANDAEAQSILKGLQQNKLPAIIQSNGSRYRIRIGPYASRDLAEQARLRSTAVVTGGTVVAMDAVPPTVNTAKTTVPTAKPNAVTAAATTPINAPKPATEPPAPVAAKPAAVASDKGFAVQVGAPANEQAAIALRDKMRSAGFNSFIQPVTTESGLRYRVRVGPENSRDAAKSLLTSVKQKTGIDGIVVSHP
jgi:cell division septation protein DedD